ncbi:glycosyltransferase family 4 protein [Phyllobacterium myrsinacearum]|uniref:Glycosyl transferase n=1 Tax=Phyllobacterium myrsinacearum TaxID=28101 RepID=A0A2S9JQ56_9HYPH|nr:glycosyltransferase family 4 protein [Phyllobacterium myrsinacearum]PRD55212.1 glycosyl transferase [Phyllobacterium myrsinacearum]PWV89207.1 glycosyltransferase involved in cell wall biosynthesis [Phyllobacterium myrsinacearum]RZV05598.1 glycosyltransferase involved in cell wall biosynthesis [Phyllobacterium myrsinacearum]
MQVAFYAPLKSPNHPTPSGDRAMARLLMSALRKAGHAVDVVSELRSFSASPAIEERQPIAAAARAEVERLTGLWQAGRKPDLWFSYHPYYKAPDLIGPVMAAALDIPYITAEASYSPRRNALGWAGTQSLVAEAVRGAAVNLCFTQRDMDGLANNIPGAHLARLKPFIETAPFRDSSAGGTPHRLVTVAMMRPGDKLRSYEMLAKALSRIVERPWTLAIAGDGPARNDVQALFAAFGDRIQWLGERNASGVAALLLEGGIYVWPGCGEAYGIAYLEAQAAGLPVVAQATAGVPEVVEDGVTGFLTREDDVPAYAAAIARLLDDKDLLKSMGANARRFVLEERSLENAVRQLDAVLTQSMGRSQ